MSNKKLIYSWNLNNPTNISLLNPNQSVSIDKINDYVLIEIKQNRSTPGTILNKKFVLQSDKIYLLEVNGLASREKSAFLFAADKDSDSSSTKRLIENYTFVSSDKFNQSACAGWCCNYVSNVEIGILVTNPKIGDKIYLKEIKLYEAETLENNEKNELDCHSLNNNNNILENHSMEENIINILDKLSNNLSNTSNVDIESNKYELNVPKEVESCVFEKSNQYQLDLVIDKEPVTFMNEEDIINACCEDESNENISNVGKNTNCLKNSYNAHKDIKSNYKLCNLFELPRCYHDDFKLKNIAESFILDHDINVNKNTNLPSGWSFFAQFMSHDLTFNSNTAPFFDLYSIYGNPDIKYLFSNNKFILGNNNTDLYRNLDGTPIIPDPRNDDNYICAQLHVLFLLFHNKLIDYYADKDNIPNLFEFVKKEVIFYYQWIIVNDFLSRLIDNDILNSICKYSTKYYSISKFNGAIPAEFAIACFRYGHFTLNNYYNIAYNLNLSQDDLHQFTKGNLPEYIIDWNKFFNVSDNIEPQYSNKINCDIARDLHNLQGPPNGCYNKPENIDYEFNSLFYRNLLRAQQFNLPSGQNIALCMGMHSIPNDTMKQFDTNGALQRNNMIDNTPLIIYMLKEAEIFKNGEMLTGCGGIIVAEVLMSILIEDPYSYFNAKWTPSLPSKELGDFTIGDLISFVYQ